MVGGSNDGAIPQSQITSLRWSTRSGKPQCPAQASYGNLGSGAIDACFSQEPVQDLIEDLSVCRSIRPARE